MGLDGLLYLHTAGRLNETSLVCSDEPGSKWMSYGSLLSELPQTLISPPCPTPPPPAATLILPPVRSAPNARPGIPEGYGYAKEPWSRLWAYCFDANLFMILGAFPLGLVLATMGLVDAKTPELVYVFIGTWTFVPVLIAGCQAMFGTTLGKAMFGIKVLTHEGNKPSFIDAVKRNYQVLIQGLWCGIPFVYLFGAANFQSRLKKNIQPGWDGENSMAYQLNPDVKRIGTMWLAAFLVFVIRAIDKVIGEMAKSQ